MTLQTCIALLLCAYPMYGQVTTAPKPRQPFFRPSIEGRVEMNFMGGLYHGPFPLSIRQVPSHPDDGNFIFTIPDAKLSSAYHTGQFSVLPGISFGERMTIRGGVTFVPFLGTSGPVKDTTSNTREINYSGTPDRGYGTTLAYYSGTIGSATKLGYVAELELRAYQDLGVVAGFSTSDYNFNVNRGYDRYDALQHLDTKPYSNDHVQNPYVGIRLNFPSEDERFCGGFYIVGGPLMVDTVPVTGIVGIPTYHQKGWEVKLILSFGYKYAKK